MSEGTGQSNFNHSLDVVNQKQGDSGVQVFLDNLLPLLLNLSESILHLNMIGCDLQQAFAVKYCPQELLAFSQCHAPVVCQESFEIVSNVFGTRQSERVWKGHA